MEVKQSTYDVSATYDLPNYMKIPTQKKIVLQLHQMVPLMHDLVY